MLIDCLKSILDNTLNISAVLGLRPYRIFSTIIQTIGDRPGKGTVSRTDTEILVGGQPPPIEQVSAKDVFSSGGLLNEKDLKVTIITSYVSPIDGYTYGTLKSLYDPTPIDGYNTQVYFHLFGSGLPSSGQYFKKIGGKEDLRTTTVLFIRATAEKPANNLAPTNIVYP